MKWTFGNDFRNFPVINVWTSDQRNSKSKTRQQTPFDEQPSSSKIRINGLGVSQDVDFAQDGKYTQNPSQLNLSHVFGNMHLNDQGSVHQSSVEPMRRISTQSQMAAASFQNSHQNSHGNYVDIDAIDTILSENENFHNFGGAAQYERNANENRIQSMMDVAIGSPIYENQTSLINRSESPIYSNTHNQSIASLYPKTQNIYSNLPAITAAPPAAAYANLPAHQGVLAPRNLINIFHLKVLIILLHFSASATDRWASASAWLVNRLHPAKSPKVLHRSQHSNHSLVASSRAWRNAFVLAAHRESTRCLLLQVSCFAVVNIAMTYNNLLSRFLSYATRQSQLHHPYLAAYFLQPNQMTQPLYPHPEYFTTHSSALVPANPLLNVEVPKWLKIYTRSSSDKDHIIKWNMFQVHQLVYINEMITKLFKEEIHNTVLKYESLR